MEGSLVNITTSRKSGYQLKVIRVQGDSSPLQTLNESSCHDSMSLWLISPFKQRVDIC